MHVFAIALCGLAALTGMAAAPLFSLWALLGLVLVALVLGLTSGMGAPRYVFFFLSAAVIAWATDMPSLAIGLGAAGAGAAWGASGSLGTAQTWMILTLSIAGAAMSIGPDSIFDPWQSAALALWMPFLIAQQRMGRILCLPAGASAGIALGMSISFWPTFLIGLAFLASGPRNTYMRHSAAGIALGALFGSLLLGLGVVAQTAINAPSMTQGLTASGLLLALVVFRKARAPSLAHGLLVALLALCVFVPPAAGLAGLLFYTAARTTPQRASSFSSLFASPHKAVPA